jgi:hypothetical protein
MSGDTIVAGLENPPPQMKSSRNTHGERYEVVLGNLAHCTSCIKWETTSLWRTAYNCREQEHVFQN